MNQNRLCRYAAAALCTGAFLLSALPLTAQNADAQADVTMEQLVNMNVSSVARRDQKLYKTPAAVYVVTRDDVRRSGADNLAELLRMVPGIQVAQVESSKWAVSARGFNSTVANKMLVMVDGRTIYNMEWSGTYWDMNEVPLDTIERIEVIRGPGATMWGANAVNGVINILTRKAEKTLGRSVEVSGGSMANSVTARIGAELAQGLEGRFEIHEQYQPALVQADGSSAYDAGHTLRMGARLDWQPQSADSIYVHGDYYRGSEDQREFGMDLVPIQDQTTNYGGYALARWEHRMHASDTALQFYFDSQNRHEILDDGHDGILDVDFQHHVPLARHEITWGAAVRVNRDHMHGQTAVMNHPHHELLQYSGFFQDEYSLVPQRLVLTAGTKLHWNNYTHTEWQPSVRLLWTPDNNHSIWAAISRPVRTPSFRDRDLNLVLPLASPYPFPMYTNLNGNLQFKSENAVSYEAGYRQKLTSTLSVDVASFFTHYNGLETDMTGQPGMVYAPIPAIIVPITFTNQGKANTQGIETLLSWTPVSTVHMTASYTWLEGHVSVSDPSAIADLPWATPRNTLAARADWDFSHHWTLAANLYSVSRTPIDPTNMLDTTVPAYERLDVGLSYAVADHLFFRAGGRNLLQPRHIEFNAQDNYTNSSEIPRSVYGKLEWKF